MKNQTLKLSNILDNNHDFHKKLKQDETEQKIYNLKKYKIDPELLAYTSGSTDSNCMRYLI